MSRAGGVLALVSCVCCAVVALEARHLLEAQQSTALTIWAAYCRASIQAVKTRGKNTPSCKFTPPRHSYRLTPQPIPKVRHHKANQGRHLTSTSHHGVSKERPAGICLPGAATSSAHYAPIYLPVCTRPRHHASPLSQTCNVGHASTRASSFLDSVKSRRVHREPGTMVNISANTTHRCPRQIYRPRMATA